MMPATQPKAYHDPRDDERETPLAGAQFAAEVSARLVEWSEIESRVRVTRWIDTLFALYRSNHEAFWLFVTWQSGDAQKIAASFEVLGAAACVPRQAVCQNTHAAFASIRGVNSELADAMEEVYRLHRPEASGSPSRSTVKVREAAHRW